MVSCRYRELHDEIKTLETELDKLFGQQDSLFTSFANNNISADRIVEYETMFEERQADLKNRLLLKRAELEDSEDLRLKVQACREALRDFDLVWDGLDMEEKQQLVSSLVESLTIHRKDRNTIIMRVKLVFREMEEIIIPGEQRRQLPKTGVESLTQRQLALLHLLQQGLSHTEIAERFSTTEQCIRSHASTIRHKLDVKTNAEAMQLAEKRITGEAEFLPVEGRKRPVSAKTGQLNTAEMELLNHLDSDISLAKLAPVLGIKSELAYTRFRLIKQKLGARDRADVIVKAKKRGLLQ